MVSAPQFNGIPLQQQRCNCCPDHARAPTPNDWLIDIAADTAQQRWSLTQAFTVVTKPTSISTTFALFLFASFSRSATALFVCSARALLSLPPVECAALFAWNSASRLVLNSSISRAASSFAAFIFSDLLFLASATMPAACFSA